MQWLYNVLVSWNAQNSFISSNSWGGFLRRVLCIGSCHLQTDLVLLSHLYVFISFVCLFVLVRTPVPCLSGKSWQTCFAPNAGENIQFLTGKYHVSCGFFRLGKLLSIPGLFECCFFKS